MAITHEGRVCLWLKTFGTLRSDGWWKLPTRYVNKAFEDVRNWEISPRTWSLDKHGNLNVLLDWSGSISDLSMDIEDIRQTLTTIGESTGYTGWARLKNLSSDDQLWLLCNLPEYKRMVT